MIIISKLVDLTGKRFGRLVVVERAEDRIEKSGKRRVMWKCLCDCGNEVTVLSDNIKRGLTLSCGCFRNEYLSKKMSTHGDTNTRLYGVWCAIKARCYNKNTDFYYRYGGRGITMCDSWRDNYENFRDWAMSNGYTEGLTIDRINNDLGYSPDNCRWATRKEQCNNRSTNRKIAFRGEVHTISEWAEILGIPARMLYRRAHVTKDPEKILST